MLVPGLGYERRNFLYGGRRSDALDNRVTLRSLLVRRVLFVTTSAIAAAAALLLNTRPLADSSPACQTRNQRGPQSRH